MLSDDDLEAYRAAQFAVLDHELEEVAETSGTDSVLSGLEPFFWHHQHVFDKSIGEHFATLDVSLRQSGSVQSQHSVDGSLDHLSTWAKPPTVLESDGRPLAAAKVLLLPRYVELERASPFHGLSTGERNALQDAVTDLKLPPSILSHFNRHRPQFWRYHDEDNQAVFHGLSTVDLRAVWRHCYSTQTTTAVVVFETCAELGSSDMTRALKAILLSTRFLDLGATLPLGLMHYLMKGWSRDMKRPEWRLPATSKRTREMFSAVLENIDRKVSVLEVPDELREFTINIRDMEFQHMHLQAMRRFLDEWTTEDMPLWQSTQRHNKVLDLRQCTKALSLHLDSLLDLNLTMKQQAHSYMEILMSLQSQEEQKISREIARATADLAEQTKKDQAVGIRIAESSKQIAMDSRIDSASMKTIAIVTMAFLPGTFVAAFFTMPIFDWEASSYEVVNARIWVYFVVMVPLTVLTFVVWKAWFERATRAVAKSGV